MKTADRHLQMMKKNSEMLKHNTSVTAVQQQQKRDATYQNARRQQCHNCGGSLPHQAGKHLARHMVKSAVHATSTIISRKCVDLMHLRQHNRSVAQRRRHHVMHTADVRHHGVTTYARF